MSKKTIKKVAKKAAQVEAETKAPAVVYKTLADLLDGETPAQFGRNLYDYTDCGPWVAFVLRAVMSRTERYTAEVRQGKDGKLICKGVNDDVANFLGFRYKNEKMKWSSVRAYTKGVRKFKREQEETEGKKWAHCEYKINDIRLGIGCVRIDLERTFKEKTNSVHYEDSGVNEIDQSQCIGIEIGSIVEGSDVELGPEFLGFPFSSDDIGAVVKGINDEAGFYWKRDNTDLFSISHDGETVGYVAWTEFDDDPVWQVHVKASIPARVKSAWSKWYTKGRWKDGMYTHPKDGKTEFMPGWTCKEEVDDSTF